MSVTAALLTPATSLVSGDAGAAVACPAEQRANSAAVVRLMRLVARVLVDVITVLGRFEVKRTCWVVRWREPIPV
ncbi:hypothetical protein NtRootA9_01100 [Arthrobacter sp. NtRootA9]|nr:hypothetical protein NtRootA9_01100 [Arthrobacter sp. NtRootA9]